MKRVIHQITIVFTISICVVGMMNQLVKAEEMKPVTLFLERVYVDGVVSQEMIKRPYMTKEEAMSEYRNWRLIKESDTELIFRTSVDDISPLLKENGYVGLSVNGILSTFEGRPANSSHIIQSFFQIDVERLESYQQEQLKKGIRIETKDDYVSLINFYKMYKIKKRPLSSE
ncbi:bypass-of-forespore protein C [Priestia megaterium]|nr:bypass-of-forespore protein C [Priestia megaterium]